MKIIFFFLTFFCVLFAKPSQVIPQLSVKVKDFFEIPQAKDFLYKDIKYRIFLAKSKLQGANYKLFVSLDGNAFFPRILNLYQNPPKEPIIIVGVGYDSPKAFDTLKRTRDYMPKVLGEDFQGGGGDKEFLSFVQEILLPFLAKKYPINPDYKAFFGHSFGGIFVLNSLLKESRDFTHFFINSPSLWWGEASFLPREIRLKSCPLIFITQGELESHLVEKKSFLSAQSLANRITQESACVAYFKSFEGQTHGSVIEKDMEFALENF